MLSKVVVPDIGDFENVDLRLFNDMLAEYGLTPVGR